MAVTLWRVDGGNMIGERNTLAKIGKNHYRGSVIYSKLP